MHHQMILKPQVPKTHQNPKTEPSYIVTFTEGLPAILLGDIGGSLAGEMLDAITG